MRWRNTTDHYGAASIGLHWLMLALIAAVYACMEFRGIFPKGSAAREAMKTWHFMLGLSVLLLALLRVAVQRWGPHPGMPVLGWLALSAGGKAIPFFGLQLPALVGESSQRADWFEETHEFGGTVGYFLIGFHAAAALFHHYWVRDNTLRRMLP